MAATPPVRLFIGSSREGAHVAHNLQAVLENRGVCEVEVWDAGIFEAGDYTLDSLEEVAARCDFAVLIASPDDVTTSRGDTSASARDNIVLEYGLFVGALGRKRTYLLAIGEVKLPTDVLGVTRLPYTPRADGSVARALNTAVLQIQDRVNRFGPRNVDASSAVSGAADRAVEDDALTTEITVLRKNAEAQGWTVKTDSATTLRLLSPRGKSHTLSKSKPEATRAELRRFAGELRADGLRVNHAIRRPVEESPY
jgi:hypothetical protein